jgi:small subunit ribosomal protein S6
MSRRYETVYIFDASLEEAPINEKLTRFHALLTKDGKGTIGNVSHLGKRTLAYRLKKKETGYYVVAKFETDGTLLAEYERAVKLDESVLRFMVVIAEAEPVVPAVAAAPIGADDLEVDEEDA